MEHQIPKPDQQIDEIDLNQIFKAIKKGFQNLFRSFLRVFLYLKNNGIKLVILLAVGLGVGFALNTIVDEKLKTEVIVKPNLLSKSYLYDVVAEINANLESRDTAFFNPLGIDASRLNRFEVTINPVETEEASSIKDDIQYLELLEKLKDESLVQEVLRNEISNKSEINHKIIFYYLDPAIGNEYSRKLMEYINSNEYFNELTKISQENAQERIVKNNQLLKQIDDLILTYSNAMSRTATDTEGRIIVDENERLDITGLLRLRNSVITETEEKRIEIQNHKEAIRIISFGQTQEVQKAFFADAPTLVPFILIVLFLFIDLLRYLNRKSKEFNLE